MAFTARVSELIAADKSGLLGKHGLWKRVSLSEIATILNGAPFDSAMFSNDGGMPLVRIRDVLAGATSTFYAGEYESAHLVRRGDLLIGMDGDFHTGYWGEQAALLNQRVCKITLDERFYDKALLGYLLPGYLSAINANTPSVTVKHLSSKTVGEIDLPLPPRNEQTRIVAKLEELLSDLDVGVAELKAAQKKLAQYRQSLLKAAVEGALTADWRRHNPPKETGADLLARILAERRARWESKQLAKFEFEKRTPPKEWASKYVEPVPPDTRSLPLLPYGWAWASVDQLSSTVRNGLSQKPEPQPPGFRILRINAVRPMRVNLGEVRFLPISEAEAKDYLLHEGDLLTTRYNGSVDLLGVFGVVRHLSEPTLHPDKLIRITPVLDKLLAEWIEIAAAVGISRSHVTSRVKTTAGQTGISGDDIKKMPVPLPALSEQETLIALVANAFSSSASQGDAIEMSRKQSTAQRQNILRAAFAGQLVPQDPNDEPASVLLERIRAERASASKTMPRKAKASHREQA